MRGDVAWKDAIAGIRADDGRTEGAQAVGCRLDVPIGLAAKKLRRTVSEGGTDQISMGKGFGGDNRNAALEQTGLDGDVHIKDLPE